MEKTRVLYIGGAGRSGSTLLDRAIGQLDGFASCGELQFIWKAGYQANQLCSCGRSLKKCSTWGSTLKQHAASRNLDEVISRLSDLTDYVGRRSSLPYHLSPVLQSNRFRESLQTYRSELAAFYRLASKNQGGDVLIDSSLDPVHALVLLGIPDLELRVLHLVRDVRAVAHSRTRRKARVALGPGSPEMPRTNPFVTAAKWAVVNRLVSRLSGIAPYRRIRYEDFVSQPKNALADVANWYEHSVPISCVDSANVLDVGITHTALGNPNKFETGRITLREDDEWRRKISPAVRWSLTGLSLFELSKYGYRVF